MNNTTKRIIFLKKLTALINFACLNGINFIITCFYRSPEEQNAKYKEGKSNCDGYKVKSFHQKWLAVDIAIVKNGKVIWDRTEDYELLGKFWKDIGGTWGGDWKLNDIYHFEWRGEW